MWSERLRLLLQSFLKIQSFFILQLQWTFRLSTIVKTRFQNVKLMILIMVLEVPIHKR